MAVWGAGTRLKDLRSDVLQGAAQRLAVQGRPGRVVVLPRCEPRLRKEGARQGGLTPGAVRGRIMNYPATGQSWNFPPKLENPPKLGFVP